MDMLLRSMIKCPLCEVAIAFLKSLVREMAGLLTYRSDGAAHEILNRPEVKELLKESYLCHRVEIERKIATGRVEGQNTVLDILKS